MRNLDTAVGGTAQEALKTGLRDPGTLHAMSEAMVVGPTQTRERRRDPRMPVAARVRIVPADGGRGLSADLIDVSAGGLRARCEEGLAPRTGARVEVEIHVPRHEPAGGRPKVHLRGLGVVVRVEAGHEEAIHEAALRFTGPLELDEPFSSLLLY